MLTEREKQFILYWEANRDREKKTVKQLLIGLPVGLLFAIPIFLSVFSGQLWYKRAQMVANSMMSPVIMIIAVICIAVFVGVFYKRHQWEMRDQQYQELKVKEEAENRAETDAAPGSK